MTLRQALLAKDQDGLSAVLVVLSLGGVPDDEVERLATVELMASPHDVQAFWLGDCNCCGQLN